MFRPIQRLTSHDPQGAMLLRLISHGCAIYSPHTSYDNSARGINQQLAELFGLQDIAPLRMAPPEGSFKIVTFVPEPALEAVQRAVWNAGAGQIGEYSRCSFSSLGTGTFQGSELTHPAVGQAGRFEQAVEVRLEVHCTRPLLCEALAALRAAHPYEEPAIDVYPLEALRSETGAGGGGRYGDLAHETTLGAFAELVKERLRMPSLQLVGNPSIALRRVAIACGAAAEFIADAAAKNCQVLLTGEARFHDCLKARDTGLGLVLPGHYATERPGVENLCGLIRAEFPHLDIWPSEAEQDPATMDVEIGKSGTGGRGWSKLQPRES